MASNDRSEKWLGGYVRTVGEGAAARRIYIIHRMVAGHRYEISTKATRESAALAQLERFEKDPAAYEAAPEPELMPEGPPPIYLNAKLIEEYLKFSEQHGGNSKNWRNMKNRFLEWWMIKLNGVDLRKADLKTHILAPLKDATSRAHRIATIKHLYAWLRDADNGKGLIGPAEDPTLSRLKVPQASAHPREQPRAFTIAAYRKMRDALGAGYRRDALDVLAATGWHYSELRRFAEDGSIEELPEGRKQPKGKRRGVLQTIHKGGGPHRTEVSPQVLAAARRIRAKGHLPEFHFALVLRQLSRKLGLKPEVTPGAFRHSVATWAKNRGAPESEISTFLGHKSPQTTARFYSIMGVPGKVWTPV